MINTVKKAKKEWLYEFAAEDRNFAIKAPRWKLKQSADLFYSSVYSNLLNNGVMPRAVFQAKVENLGDTVSMERKKNYDATLELYFNGNTELNRLREIKEPSEENTLKISALTVETKLLKDALIDYETAEYLVYQNTAEAKARDKTILWLLMFLSYEKVGENYVELFDGTDLDAKLDSYEDIQDDKFLIEVLRRINYLISLWFMNRIETEEEFADYDKENIKKDETIKEVVEQLTISNSQ